MKICVFDTETTGIEENKMFCYNVGYLMESHPL